MRDGLSILDQVLSFSEGPVTAQRVRDVLGLIPEDLYGELLRLVAERDTKAVFPLVDRLIDAGADLGEFVAGAGETLRAVLLAGLGGEPEGLTEGLQALVRQHASRLPPPEKGPLTVDRLRALWPRIIEDARAKSPMLGALLQATEVAGADGSTVAIRLRDINPVHAEGLQRQRDALALLVGRYVTEPVRITLEGATSGARSSPRPARMTEAGARADPLQALRAEDPSLNTAIEALDLEVLE